MQRRQAMLALAGAACAMAGPARPAVDVSSVLERGAPAPVSPGRTAMVAVARAGARLVAAGVRGLVLLSDDHGANWRVARTPVRAGLTAVRFANERQGWAVGHLGVVLRTEDGGETWSRQLDGLVAARLLLASAEADLRSGASDARQRRQRAAQQAVDDGADKPWLDLCVDDANSAMVVGAYGLAFITADAGRSWQPFDTRVDNPKGAHLYRVLRAEAATYIIGEQGLLLRSPATGAQFTALATPYTGSWFGAVTFGPARLLVHGLRGRMYRSEDGGEHWQAVPGKGEAALNASLQLANGRVLLGDQAGRLLIGDAQARAFEVLALPRRLAPVSDVAQAGNGDLVVATASGMVTLPSNVLRT